MRRRVASCVSAARSERSEDFPKMHLPSAQQGRQRTGADLERSTVIGAGRLVDTVGFELLGPGLAQDVEAAIKSALSDGAVFAEGNGALPIFRRALADSIRSIESHPRGDLFQEFLRKGPYEDVGKIPPDIAPLRLSDAETAAVITFIFSHMVNCFKGAVTELLAAGACTRLVKRLKRDGGLPDGARLYVGDSVRTHRKKGKGLLKGADLHILVGQRGGSATSCIAVAGVAEVKSYIRSQGRLDEQLDRHLRRARRGLCVGGVDYPAEKICLGFGKDQRVVRITVLPSNWKLPRTYRFENSEKGRLLCVTPGCPSREDDEIPRTSDAEWDIRLRWSKEALAEAAYEMTFWYMSQVGERVYSESLPRGWEKMTPSDAGRNAAKMMLFYAILRCRRAQEEQRAIALYNSYGYGYALGMNYRNAKGRREMLWPQDLDEILAAGKTKDGCRIR